MDVENDIDMKQDTKCIVYCDSVLESCINQGSSPHECEERYVSCADICRR